MSVCSLCPRKCSVDRSNSIGQCGVGELPRLARASLHFWEEPCISGSHGSGTVFFSGCPLSCLFCQNREISHGRKGEEVSVDRLRQIMEELIAKGAHNINLVNPTHYTKAICEALEEPLPVPVVWNSSGYELPETLALLKGKVDIFLPDFKYSDGDLAAECSRAPDYFQIACRAITSMVEMAGKPQFTADGLLKSGVLIRHLVLPGCEENTRGVIDWVSDTFPDGQVLFSLMGQYTPYGGAIGHPTLGRRLREDEYAWACNYLRCSGLEEAYCQDLSSADTVYIPEFDGRGVSTKE